MLTRWNQFLNKVAALAVHDTYECEFFEPQKVGRYSLVLMNLYDKKNGKKLGHGIGVDKSSLIARKKALSEACESFGINSTPSPSVHRNGIACHVSPEKAKFSAYSELIERHTILWHWFAKIPAREMEIPNKLSNEILDINQNTDLNLNPKCSELILSPDPNLKIIVFSEKSIYGCWILGWGAAGSLLSATEKSFREYLTSRWAHSINQRCNSLSFIHKGSQENVDSRHLFAENHGSTAIKENSDLINRLFHSPQSVAQPFNHKKYNLAFSNTGIANCKFTQLPSVSDSLFTVKAEYNNLFCPEFGSQLSEQYKNHSRFIASFFLNEAKSSNEHSDFFPLHPID